VAIFLRLLLLLSAVLLGRAAIADAPTPALQADLTGFQAVVRDYTAEVELGLPPIEQDLKSEAAAVHEFEQYLRRMRADAAMQRTVLALTTRAGGLLQDDRNWQGWELIAQDRHAHATETVEAAAGVRRNEEEQWILLGDGSEAELPANLLEAYQRARALHQRKLTVLTRLEALAGRGAADARQAIALCAATRAAIVDAASRWRARFIWTRSSLRDFAIAVRELVRNRDATVLDLAPGALTEWQGEIVAFGEANWLATLTAIVVAVGLIWRRRSLKAWLLAHASRLPALQGMPRRLAVAAAVALNESLLACVAAVVLVILLLILGPTPPSWLEPLVSIGIALFLWRYVSALVGAAFDPDRPHRRFVPMDDARAAAIRRQLRRLLQWFVIVAITTVLVERGVLTAPPLMLAVVAVELLALRAVRTTLREDQVAAWGLSAGFGAVARRWRATVGAAALVMIGLCGFGFINLAWFVGWGMLKTTVLFAAAALVWRVGSEWLHQRRAAAPLTVGALLARLWNVLMPVAVVCTIPFLWGVHDAVMHGLQQVLGFNIDFGGRPISVLRLTVAVTWVVLAWLLARTLARVLDSRILQRAPLDAGVRTTIVMSLNYLLFFAGGLAAIRTLGFELTNFAIVAGALGVGIGLGLQSLVNNFVGGLIILFERPFRIGDVLEHDGTLGHVRRIRTRSTVVKTFQGSELVLPNAELVTNKIINWTLTDNRCMAEIPVQVAYGSDVRSVRDTLERVAKEHPRVVEEPHAYFTAFGNEALQFRLMVWLDVRERLQVVSDLHFAIDAAFREQGIQTRRV
jgi:small-conductance mechanosensitive channel